MGKGGGGYQPPNPVAQTKAAIEQERIREQYAVQREDRQRQEAEAEQVRLDAQKAADEKAFGHQLNYAMRDFQSGARDALERRGLTGVNRSRFIPLIDQEAERLRGLAPSTGTNASQYFDVKTILDQLVEEETQYERSKLNTQLNGVFSNGFANNMIGDDADDAFIDEIINGRATDTQGMIDRSYKRGNLNDAGLAAAMAAMGEQRSSANARLQELGGGLLETGRESLRTIGSNARDQANAFTFGDSFDFDGITGNLNNTRDSFLGGLRGKLDNAIGGDPLFDINNLLFRGGTKQGAQNETGTSPALLSAIAGEQERKNKTIGLGNTGAF